jgi:hypothetical protein
LASCQAKLRAFLNDRALEGRLGGRASGGRIRLGLGTPLGLRDSGLPAGTAAAKFDGLSVGELILHREANPPGARDIPPSPIKQRQECVREIEREGRHMT